MYKSLSPGAIGIRDISLPETIELAKATGFGGVAFSIREAADLVAAHDLDYVRALFAKADVRPGHWGLPVAWSDDAQWEQDLQELPDLAALARDLGSLRTATWITPGSDVRDFEANSEWHVQRLRPIAQTLKEYGVRFGLEFIGPKTSRAQARYSFVYTLDGMMELAQAIGTGNVGVMLDAWHLYTSGGSVEDLDRITAEDVVIVHVNDAPEGVAREAQIDNVRRLPMETGVIDLAAFMQKLAAMGYDGPVMPEPFSQRLNEIAADDPRRAAQETAESMRQLWDASGLD